MSNSRRIVKPRTPDKVNVSDFEPVVLTPEDTSDVETFHAFTINDVDYYGTTRVSFDEARKLAKQMGDLAREGNPLRADELICVAVYGAEAWEALDGFEGIRKEDYQAIVKTATDLVFASLGKA